MLDLSKTPFRFLFLKIGTTLFILTKLFALYNLAIPFAYGAVSEEAAMSQLNENTNPSPESRRHEDHEDEEEIFTAEDSEESPDELAPPDKLTQSSTSAANFSLTGLVWFAVTFAILFIAIFFFT